MNFWMPQLNTKHESTLVCDRGYILAVSDFETITRIQSAL